MHGDGIARGDGRAGARLDDFHGGGDTGDGLHGREDVGYDEKEERGERPAHSIVMRTRIFCDSLKAPSLRDTCENWFVVFTRDELAGVHALSSRRLSDHVSSPDARVDSRISTRYRLFASAPRVRSRSRADDRTEPNRFGANRSFVHCPCCPPKNPSAHRTSCMSASSPSHVFLAASLTRSARILRLSLD